MKLLWISNAPWTASGYGSQTRQLVPRIAASGIEVECVANDGTRGDREWQGILVRGSGYDRYSRDSLLEDMRRSGADAVISLYDAWVYTEGMRDPFEGVPNVASWVPVDHFPTPMSLYAWLGNGHRAIAMSRFGERCLRDTSKGFELSGAAGFPVDYAPHAIEDVFYPRDRSFREDIGVPADAYLVGIVAANNGTKIVDRKGFGEMAHALGRFMAAHPDAYVYVHTVKETHDGINLDMLFGFCDVPTDRLRWADQYAVKKGSISDGDMARIYSAFDVLLGTSRGEGFGLPHLEAQACGVPVILSNWTASAELVAPDFDMSHIGTQRHPSGWLAGVDPEWDPRHGADFAKPLIGSIILCLTEAYERRGDETLQAAAIAKSEHYRADRVFNAHWRPILEQLAYKPNREQRRQKKRKAAA